MISMPREILYLVVVESHSLLCSHLPVFEKTCVTNFRLISEIWPAREGGSSGLCFLGFVRIARWVTGKILSFVLQERENSRKYRTHK